MIEEAPGDEAAGVCAGIWANAATGPPPPLTAICRPSGRVSWTGGIVPGGAVISGAVGGARAGAGAGAGAEARVGAGVESAALDGGVTCAISTGAGWAATGSISASATSALVSTVSIAFGSINPAPAVSPACTAGSGATATGSASGVGSGIMAGGAAGRSKGGRGIVALATSSLPPSITRLPTIPVPASNGTAAAAAIQPLSEEPSKATSPILRAFCIGLSPKPFRVRVLYGIRFVCRKARLRSSAGRRRPANGCNRDRVTRLAPLPPLRPRRICRRSRRAG